MEQKEIEICLTENAQAIMQRLGMNPNEYGTAYNGESAGLDLYNIGSEVKILGRNKWTVFGEKTIQVPTGVRVNIPAGLVGLIKARGSIISTGLIVRAGVIDSGYTGEIFANLVNIGERDTTIEVGAKLPVQLVVVPCYNIFKAITYADYLKSMEQSSRWDGNLGSSN
jgi:dUTPase